MKALPPIHQRESGEGFRPEQQAPATTARRICPTSPLQLLQPGERRYRRTTSLATELRLPTTAPHPGNTPSITPAAANTATRSCPASSRPNHPPPATVAEEGDATAAPQFAQWGRWPPHHHGATPRARPRHHGAAPPTEGRKVPHEEAAPRTGRKTTAADSRTPPETTVAATDALTVARRRSDRGGSRQGDARSAPPLPAPSQGHRRRPRGPHDCVPQIWPGGSRIRP
jgi:hypothetical protein